MILPHVAPQPTVPLDPAMNRVPDRLQRIHLMGICGVGMASLAGLLQDRGFSLSGSDRQAYPPMSDLLNSLGIPIRNPHDARHLSPAPDLVIVGNVITRDNPEAVELARLNLPYLSFPQAIRHFFLEDRHPIVICGTHGKTTTSALVAWSLQQAGQEPSFMIGGIPLNFQTSFRLAQGACFVLEGDEYDTAFFDKGPKFLHYRPRWAVITSIEFDHADIYRDLDHVVQSFERLLTILPGDGMVFANADDPVLGRLLPQAPCRVVTYGLTAPAEWQAEDIVTGAEGTRLSVLKSGKPLSRLLTPLYGRHNVANLLAAFAVGTSLGIPARTLAAACGSFAGVRRRQELLGRASGILVLDDFAHHPTAVRETIRAVKVRYAPARLVAVFEPRSNSSRRRTFQDLYARAFDEADLVFVPEPAMTGNIPVAERFSARELVKGLKLRGFRAHDAPDPNQLLASLLSEAREGDLVLFMSNGPFDDLPKRFLQELREQESKAQENSKGEM